MDYSKVKKLSLAYGDFLDFISRLATRVLQEHQVVSYWGWWKSWYQRLGKVFKVLCFKGKYIL